MSNYLEKFEKMRIAGKLAAQTLDMLAENIKEGVSTDYIDKLGYEFIRDNGGYSAPLFYRGFKKSLCTSLNHVVCHGVPSKDRILEEGDAVTSTLTASPSSRILSSVGTPWQTTWLREVHKDFLKPR